MKYTLVCTQKEVTKVESQHASPSEPNYDLPFDITFIPILLSEQEVDGKGNGIDKIEEQKINAEKSVHPGGLLSIRIKNYCTDNDLQRQLTIVFKTYEQLEHFLNSHKEESLNFDFFPQKEDDDAHIENPIFIMTNILSPKEFEKLKTILIRYFDLDEKGLEPIFSIAGPSSQILKAREEIGKLFIKRLKAYYFPTEETKALKEYETIDTLAEDLIKQAHDFDTHEQLGQHAVALRLGNTFLSFGLTGYAKNIFQQIMADKPYESSSAYIAAQLQLANLHGVEGNLENSVCAALNSRDNVLSVVYANLLCGQDFCKPEDFVLGLEGDSEETIVKKIMPGQALLVKFLTKLRDDHILIDRQKEEIKQLKEENNQLKESLANKSANSAPEVAAAAIPLPPPVPILHDFENKVAAENASVKKQGEGVVTSENTDKITVHIER